MSKRTDALAFLQQEAHEHHTGPQASCTAGLCHRLRSALTGAETEDRANQALRRAVEAVAIPKPGAKDVAPAPIRKQLQDAMLEGAAEHLASENAMLVRDNALMRMALEFGGQCSIGRLLRLESVVGAVGSLMEGALKLWPDARQMPPEVAPQFGRVAGALHKMREANEDPLTTLRTIAATDKRITERFDAAVRMRDAALQAIVTRVIQIAQTCARCDGSGQEKRLVVVEGERGGLLPCAACGEWRELLDGLRGKAEIAPDEDRRASGKADGA